MGSRHGASGDHLASELLAFGRFLTGLPGFLRDPMTPGQAAAIVAERLANRERNFLAVVERGVVQNPRSPYRQLLAEARCEFGDLEQMVRQQGLETTLRHLHDAGVYLTFEEFKGRAPIIRNGREIPAALGDFDNPLHRRYFAVSSGGSTGTARRVNMDLTHMRARMPHRILFRVVNGILDLPVARWQNIPPGNGLTLALIAIPARERLEAWFTSANGRGDGTSPRFAWATRIAIAVARLTGFPVRWPQYLPLDQAATLAQWAHDQVRANGACVVRGAVSRMVRVAVAAEEMGLDLAGVMMTGGGEPPTPAKVATITRSGATFRASYSFSEAGSVGSACLNSDDPNDQHFFQDHLGMIQSPRMVPGFDIEVAAFCYTTLLPTAPKVLINVESDDYGVVEHRSCGCPWERMGFPLHLTGVRSFGKLTGEGITLVGSDVERVLEEVLPARFGGSPLDYQLEELEDERGFTRVVLRIAPQLLGVDEDAAVAVVLEALRQIGAGGASTANVWGQAGTMAVLREAPEVTARGKLMPLHLSRLNSRRTRSVTIANPGESP